MTPAAALSALVDKFDEAEHMKRVTSGETLTYWEEQYTALEAEIKEIIDEMGAVQCARHILFSPAF